MEQRKASENWPHRIIFACVRKDTRNNNTFRALLIFYECFSVCVNVLVLLLLPYYVQLLVNRLYMMKCVLYLDLYYYVNLFALYYYFPTVFILQRVVLLNKVFLSRRGIKEKK